MKPAFPDVYRTKISYTFRTFFYEIVADDGNITVIESPDYESIELDESILEYWVGALIFWYESSWANAWTEDDYAVAAFICRMHGSVLEAADLEKICGISTEYGVKSRNYAEAKRRYDIKVHRVSSLVEGAD